MWLFNSLYPSQTWGTASGQTDLGADASGSTFSLGGPFQLTIAGGTYTNCRWETSDPQTPSTIEIAGATLINPTWNVIPATSPDWLYTNIQITINSGTVTGGYWGYSGGVTTVNGGTISGTIAFDPADGNPHVVFNGTGLAWDATTGTLTGTLTDSSALSVELRHGDSSIPSPKIATPSQYGF